MGQKKKNSNISFRFVTSVWITKKVNLIYHHQFNVLDEFYVLFPSSSHAIPLFLIIRFRFPKMGSCSKTYIYVDRRKKQKNSRKMVCENINNFHRRCDDDIRIAQFENIIHIGIASELNTSESLQEGTIKIE